MISVIVLIGWLPLLLKGNYRIPIDTTALSICDVCSHYYVDGQEKSTLLSKYIVFLFNAHPK